LAATIAGKITKKPTYIDFTDFYSDIAETDSNKLVVKMLKKMEKFILKNAQKIMVVSEVMRERLGEMEIDKKKIAIVEDGVDKNMFHPYLDQKQARKELNLPPDIPIIIYHGDIKYPDGVDVLYLAFEKVLKEIPQTKLLVVGGGGDYFNKEIKKLGEKLGIENSLIYTGWIDHKQVPFYLRASNIGAMPMRATLNHNCYLSFKMFEYWASALPVVTTQLKAITPIVEEGKAGIIIEPENINQLSEALIYLIKNPKIAEEMGKNGRKLVEERFHWDVLMEKEAEFYKNS